MKRIKNAYRNKLLSAFIVFGLLIIFSMGLTVFNIVENNRIKNSLHNAEEIHKEKEQLFEKHIENIKDKLFSINTSKIFTNYLQDKSDQLHTMYAKELFLNIAQTNSNIMQLRYINKNGLEELRIDRKSPEYEPELIPNDMLQNKEHRYYFKEVSKLTENEVWYSSIDLNIEHKKIQIPIKPVLRVGIPVFYKAKVEGILIINVFMQTFLEDFIRSNSYDISLVDKDGYFIVSSQTERNWGKYLKSDFTLMDLNDDAKAILSRDEMRGEAFYSKLLNFNNGENIKILFQAKSIQGSKILSDEKKSLFLMLFIITLVSIPLAYLFSKKPIELENELEDYNTYLQEKIDIAVNHHKEDQKRLFHQNRLAQMGEMLSMIAHQWRQPLSVISTIASRVKISLCLGELTDSKLDEDLSLIEKQTQHLSQTIRDFQNFYKPDNILEETSLDKLLNSSLSLINDIFESKNIRVIQEINSKAIINVYANEVQQAILAILQNSLDALIEKNQEDKIVTLKTYEKKGQKFIEICDNAGGIPADIMDDIFVPYFSTKGKNGTGVGLYMSKIIIEEHCKGRLSASNNDEGAVFTISL